MARTLLVAGTASHVGKSTVAAGLCRALADRGLDVAPYKAQNMSNNARAAPIPDAAREETDLGDGDDGDRPASGGRAFGEIGVSQHVQARAARTPPTTDCNPVLLKPRGSGESQLVVDGRAVGHFPAGQYYESHWERARAAAVAAHERLAAAADVVIAEGAGSVAEINLHDRDLANVETARFADADVVLVADIERGGAFASLAGSLELMPDDVRERVVGAVVTKFRGDRSILAPGLEEFEDRFGVPILGVLPYDDPGLPEEDSVAVPPGERTALSDDGRAEAVTVAVPRLPRVSNFTDLEPLAAEPGVRVEYRPPGDGIADAEAVVLPGTKNTVDDLLALREAGFGERLRAFDGPVVGLCGGYQLLGERLTDAAVESADDPGTVRGFGLLPVETRFDPDKRVTRVERSLRAVGPLAPGDGRELGTAAGYEIHAGRTELIGPADRPFDGEGAATDDALGTYLHGLFENPAARGAFLDRVFGDAGIRRPDPADRESPYERAAALVADHVDLAALGFDEH